MSEAKKCEIVDGEIKPCEEMKQSLDEDFSLRLTQLKDGKSYIYLDYTGRILEYCPWCAAKIHEEGDL